MTDAGVSLLDAVVIPGKDVSRPSVGASSQDSQPFLAVCPPAPAHMMEREREQGKSADGSVDNPVDRPELPLDGKRPNGTITGGHVDDRLGVAKPVEVVSVPETPLHGSTPAEGTPRPELKIAPEPARPAAEATPEPVIEPIVESGGQESKAAKEPNVNGSVAVDKPEVKPGAPVTHTGPESASLPAPVAPPASISEKPSSSTKGPELSRRAEANGAVVGGKRKLDHVAIPAKAKTVKPKKEKKLPPVGKTARKTRSQGPVDA